MDILKPFKRKPLESFAPWTEAPRLRELGYSPLPIERQAAERGQEQPLGGGWSFGLPDPVGSFPHVVGILAGRLPYGSTPLDECQKTWLAVLRLEGFDSKPAQRDALAILAPVIGDAPVREAVDRLDVLVPMRIEVPDCRVFGLRKTGWLNLCGAVSIFSGSVSFLASGPAWRWRDGRSLLDVPRGSLPLLTWETAARAVEEVHLSLIDRAA